MSIDTKYKRLIVFGDSMTYGHNMYDADNVEFKKPSDKTWANIVSNYYNLVCVNKSIPGSGNDSIIRNFHEYILGFNKLDGYHDQERFKITYEKGDVVIVGLSMLQRMEVHSKKRYNRLILNYKYMSDMELQNSFKYIISITTESALFLKMLHDIHTVQSICKAHNIPYIIFNALNPLTVNNSSEIINIPIDCQNQFNSVNNLNWIKSIMHRHLYIKMGKDAFLPCTHPNESGHKLWGNFIIDYIEQYKLFDKE